MRCMRKRPTIARVEPRASGRLQRDRRLVTLLAEREHAVLAVPFETSRPHAMKSLHFPTSPLCVALLALELTAAAAAVEKQSAAAVKFQTGHVPTGQTQRTAIANLAKLPDGSIL